MAKEIILSCLYILDISGSQGLDICRAIENIPSQQYLHQQQVASTTISFNNTLGSLKFQHLPVFCFDNKSLNHVVFKDSNTSVEY
jgi:hypothetical protein